MVNRGRVRGLLGKLRGRVLHLQAERGALQEQLARLSEFGEGNGLLAAQVCLLLATFVVILVVFVSMMHAVVLPACQALHTRGRHCSILHAFDCREHCKLRERELVGKDVFVGAYLQSQDLQRQFSRRQDEIDAENMALADKLERAVQAATVDAAEKKSLQVQC